MAPGGTTDADVIQNKINVLLANQQRLLSSWLPPRTAEEMANSKSPEQIEKEEEHLFAPVPATLGVGAPLPNELADGSTKRKELSSNDRLRKKLLGKRAGGSSSVRIPSTSATSSLKTARPLASSSTGPDHSDDDEGGRSSLGTSKRRDTKDTRDEGHVAKSSRVVVEGGNGAMMVQRPRTKRISSHFLDQVLAEKSQKKRRRRQQKDKAA